MKGRNMNYKARMKLIKGQKIDIDCYRSTPRKSQMFFDCTGEKRYAAVIHFSI